MVRMYWHVDDGCCAFVPVNGLGEPKGSVQDVGIDMEVPGVSGYASGLLTIPKGLTDGVGGQGVRKVGIVLAHDADSSQWKGELANALAQVRTLYVGLHCSVNALASLPLAPHCLRCPGHRHPSSPLPSTRQRC